MQPRLLAIALLSAGVGCAAAVGLVQGFGLGAGHTTTVVERPPLVAETDGGNVSTKGLTARDIYKRDAPGVVFVRSQVVQRSSSPFDFGAPQEQQGEATGSGFVIARDGTILTNAHVVNGATKVTVQFADKRSAVAEVLGKDESTDLALLKVDPKGLTLSPLSLGSSRGVQVGDPAIAIGNPFGLERTLTTGVISAVKRTIQAPNNFEIDDVIQTDAPINPGNSGGPLIDAGGRVIGINSQIETGGSASNGNVGIGFAVPIDTAKKIIPQLKASGRVDRGYLGVSTIPVDRSLRDLNLPVDHGALVQSVPPGGPADKAGLEAGTVTAQLDGQPIQLGGDIITKIDGTEIRSKNDLTDAIQSKKQGDKVRLTFVRGEQTKTVEATLAQQPAQVQTTAPQTP
jgi:putative serine protease PepD